MKDAIETLETYYQQETEGYAPERLHIKDRENTMLLMPGFTALTSGTKIVTVAPGNKEKDLKLIHGLMVLNERETGKPIALCDAGYITEVRTGAIGGLGIKYLSRKDVRTLGIIGTGIQGESQLRAAMEVRNFEKVYFYSRTQENRAAYRHKMSAEFPHVNFIESSPEEIKVKCDVIVGATNSSTPVLPETVHGWEGKLLVSVGSFRPDMTELPEVVWDIAAIVGVDTASAWKESGDMLKAKEKGWSDKDVFTLSSLIKQGERKIKDRDTNLFKSVGNALFDVIVANALVNKARQKGAGVRLED